MDLVLKGHRLEVYPKDMIDKMIMPSIETRSMTFSDLRRSGRAMTIPDKRFFHKMKDRSMYIFASTQLPDIKKFLDNNDVKYTLTVVDRDYSGIKASIEIKEGMKLRDNLQREYSVFLDQKLPSILCNLQTGKGKTGSTIISLLKRTDKFRLAGLIPPRHQITWIEALLKFTTIDSSQILIVSGRSNLCKLKELSDDIQVVILSPATIREYVKSYLEGDELPFPPEKIMEFIGSEDLIIDETHEDFGGNYLNVLALNPKRFIALTASYSSRSDSDKIKKFKRYFIPDINRLPEAELSKYINIVFCQYKLESPTKVQHKNDITGWYNHPIYEQSILDVESFKESYFRMIIWFTRQYYDNKHRLLFLFYRINICIEFQEWLVKNNIFKDKTISMFISGDKDKENLKSDIVISTGQSGGTGIDIENLQTTVNTINTGSDYSCIQYSGRNREMKDVEQYFLTLSATNIQAHMAYLRSNRELYEDRAKNLFLNYFTEGNVCSIE